MVPVGERALLASGALAYSAFQQGAGEINAYDVWDQGYTWSKGYLWSASLPFTSKSANVSSFIGSVSINSWVNQE